MAKKRDIEGNRLHHFELSDKNRTVRWILIGVLLVVGAIALTFGLTKALETPAGWQTVEVSSAKQNCSHEFTFMYDFGAGEMSATQERKALAVLYGQLTENAWQLFYNEAGESELNGLWLLNQHPNEEVQVDPYLYQAFGELEESGNRAIYLGPVYAVYDDVFYSVDSTTAAYNDPTHNEDIRAYVQQLAKFAADPETIRLELRPDNRVVLHMSDEYLAFAEENELQYLLDFGWLRNAFAIDYMAQQLMENGFTNGYIVSGDGFTRNLDQRGTAFSLDLVSQGTPTATMDYAAPMSIVTLRSYSLYRTNPNRYYTFSDGRTLTSFIDPADGQDKCAADDLVAYAADLGCAKLALSVMPVYVADTLAEDALNTLAQQGIYSIWYRDKTLCYNQQDLKLSMKDTYTAKLVN